MEGGRDGAMEDEEIDMADEYPAEWLQPSEGEEEQAAKAVEAGVVTVMVESMGAEAVAAVETAVAVAGAADCGLARWRRLDLARQRAGTGRPPGRAGPTSSRASRGRGGQLIIYHLGINWHQVASIFYQDNLYLMKHQLRLILVKQVYLS